MMYPVEFPTNKHDLVGPALQSNDGSDESLPPNCVFPSTSKLFEALEEAATPGGTKVAAVYTYPDGPSHPGPLSRALFVIGFAGRSLSVVRKLINDDEEIPACIQKCTVAVKLADASHVAELQERDNKNSRQFAKFMTRLRKEDAVAIIGVDKHQRFALLCPMEQQHDSPSNEPTAEDFAALCYVGNVQEVKEFLAGGGSGSHADSKTEHGAAQEPAALWQPPGANYGATAVGEQASTSGFWKPPATDDNDVFGVGETGAFDSWQPEEEGQSVAMKRKRSDSNDEEDANPEFHDDSGAAAADRFYSGLKRDLGTRADSRLYHMRSFNGWVKAIQIQELEPRTQQDGNRIQGGPLRVLDLACGKGGDLGKWVLHRRGVSNYVGIDVARGSLSDAAIRARKMRKKLKRCTFTCADLGADVPGRPRSPNQKKMQELLTWSLQSESEYESRDPEFKMVRGGGISADDKFDVVSIQFAIHYMMSSRARALRFFQTVSQLLEIGGNLIVTTIDARVVLEHMMDSGADLHFDGSDTASDENNDEGITIQVGNGACRIRFENDIVRRIFQPQSEDDAERLYGLQYTFTLVEGSDHAAGVGDAVNLPEWLTPIPALTSLASEAGLELEYAQNFHEFFDSRRDPSSFPAAHQALYNMKVLDRLGSISKDEWEVSRLYAALKFRKVRESRIVLHVVSDEEENQDETVKAEADGTPTARTNKMFPIAMMKAKKEVGEGGWQSMSSEEKNALTQQKLDELAKT